MEPCTGPTPHILTKKSWDQKLCSARFAGFKEPERERIAKHFTNNFNLDMLDRELSVKGCNQNLELFFCIIFWLKGWNWGVANFNGSVLNFEVTEHLCFMILVMFEISTCKVGKHDAFEIPLTYVQHCQAQKNEVELKYCVFYLPSIL